MGGSSSSSSSRSMPATAACSSSSSSMQQKARAIRSCACAAQSVPVVFSPHERVFTPRERFACAAPRSRRNMPHSAVFCFAS
eukprot:1626536-Prymnesium_polylepis.1